MYDRKEIYEKNIKKLAEEIYEICKSYGVATFLTFCVYDDGNSTEYKNFINGSKSNGFIFKDDRIRKHINVANGFATVPPDEEMSIDEYMDID